MIEEITISQLFTNILLPVYVIITLSLILVVITENRNPLKTIAWVLVLLFAPFIGLIFYFFFGQDNRKQRIISRRSYKRLTKYPSRELYQHAKTEASGHYKPLATLLYNNAKATILQGSYIEPFTSGKEKFDKLKYELHKAQHHIHLQYYIIDDDKIGNEIKQILIEKAQAGVEVRVLYDDVGCWSVPSKFFKEMIEKGVEVHTFLRVAFPLLTSKVNYRNHRKIVVIDGKCGFVGGMNIADRYVQGSDWGEWRDTHLFIEGQGVYGLQSAFLVDWYVASKKLIYSPSYFPACKLYGTNKLQIVTGGPVGPWRTLLQASIWTIANAKKYVYIQTPYFLPTESINMALQTAALSGIDVRIMIPKYSDSKLVNFASRSYIDEMLKAGVKIYFYTKGFLHSKTMIVDDYLSVIGSANLDFRSFEHNFEINAYMYDPELSVKMRNIYHFDENKCERVIPVMWFRRPLRKKIAESVMRLFSPLL